MATIWDADVLIWAASQIVEAENHGLTTSRFFRFTPYQLLRAVGRETGNWQYQLLKAALARLQSDRHRHHDRQRCALEAPAIFLGQRMGRDDDERRPRRRAWSSSCPNGSTTVWSTARSCWRSIPRISG